MKNARLVLADGHGTQTQLGSNRFGGAALHDREPKGLPGFLFEISANERQSPAIESARVAGILIVDLGHRLGNGFEVQEMCGPASAVGLMTVLTEVKVVLTRDLIPFRATLSVQLQIIDEEESLTRIISQLERLSTKEDADKVVSGLLRKFNVVTGLSSWTDPKNIH